MELKQSMNFAGRIKKIFIVHHTHTDIGYTDIQTKIFDDHINFIDRVLDYCSQTDKFPEDSKFRWTCEVSWTVKNYFEERPERIAEFIRRVKEGRIEVTALYLNCTESYTAEEFVRSLCFAKKLEKKYGIKVITAMNADIPGLSWAIPQILAGSGIKYLSMASNEIRAKAVAVPRPFYWLSPDGSKVLVWNAGREGWYCEGLLLGFNKSYRKVSELLPPYLERLEENGYPYDAICMQGAEDNGPPHSELSEIVRKWNEKHTSPKIIISIISNFFLYIEKRYKNKFPSYKLAWPDWWADGTGSAAYETGLSRRMHRELITAEKWASILFSLGKDYPEEKIKEVWNNLFFFDEHTWGTTCEYSPDSPQAKGQWAIKSSFVYKGAVEANRLLQEAFSILTSKIKNSGKEKVVVFNPMAKEGNGLVVFRLPIENWKENSYIKDGNQILPLQVEEEIQQLESARKRWVKIFFPGEKIPSLGYKTFEILHGRTSFKSNFSFRGNAIENRFYRIILDSATGGIKSIKDKELNRELVDRQCPYNFNQYIYEEIISKEGRNAIWDAASTLPNWAPEKKRKDAEFRRISPKSCRIKKGKNGPVMGSLVGEVRVRGCSKITQEIILYDNLKRIDIVNTLFKEENLNPEGIYYAFPFNFRNPEIRFKIAGAVMRPEIDQLPGSAKGYYSIQDWLSISNKDYSVIWVTKEAPLVQPGEINTGKWLDKIRIGNGTFFSWVMNNYWYTNFPLKQAGITTFHYSITSVKGKVDDAEARIFAQECNNPLVALPKGQNSKGTLPEKKCSFITLDKKNIILLALKKAMDKKELIIRLVEMEGKDTVVKVTLPFLKIKKAYQTNLVEETPRRISTQQHTIKVSIKSLGIATIKIENE